MTTHRGRFDICGYTDLDPQLVWRGKDEQDWSDLVVNAPPLCIQEKVHPKVLIDDLLKQTNEQEQHGKKQQLDLLSDFNRVPVGADRTDFYQHDQNWSMALPKLALATTKFSASPN